MALSMGSKNKNQDIIDGDDMNAVPARPPYLVKAVLLVVGLLISLVIFFILNTFIGSLIEQEQERTSQDFVEGIVADFNGLGRPLHSLSELVALSADVNDADALAAIVSAEDEKYKHYDQIIWFYKNDAGKWAFSNLLTPSDANEFAKRNQLKPSGEFLKLMLEQGVHKASDGAMPIDGINFKSEVLRQSPRVATRPLALAKAVTGGDGHKGFLLGVIDVTGQYDDGWIGRHGHVAMMRIHDIQANKALYEFDRFPNEPAASSQEREVYEFPFGGRTLEVSGVFATDTRTGFLSSIPYLAALLGALLSALAAFFVHTHERQNEILTEMNEVLEEKNFALKNEAEERERLNRSMQQTELKTRAVIDAVNDIIFEADNHGQIVFLNKAWQAYTGFEVEQSKGLHLKQLIHQDDQEQLSVDFRALISDEKNSMRMYTQIRNADGSFKPVELVMKKVIQEGERPRVIGTFTDIEERRRAERALSDAEKKYRSIVENAAGGIFQLTAEGVYLSVNPAFARILKYESPDHVLKEVKNAHEQVYMDFTGRQAFYQKLHSSGDILHQEVQIRSREGNMIWVRESVRAVKDESGQLLFFEGSIEDITERRESERAIREAKMSSDLANRAKSEFISNMSHELRTPLNSIIGFSEMIKNEVFGTIEQRSYWEYARDIHDSGQKLLRVINEILDISKIEAGERQLNEGVVKIKDVINAAEDLLDVKIDNTKLTITKSLENLPDIVGEELAVKQIMLNILSNAVKFTPEGGRVTISGHVAKDGRLHISITDTGIGLDEYEIDKALSPFGQIDNELSRSGSGTGLGLTLVDALIKLHGGDFELISQKGIGTTANIIFPSERVVQKEKEDKPVFHEPDTTGEV